MIVVMLNALTLLFGLTHAVDKRLLLNDPDALNARLTHLEQMINQMKTSHQSEITQLKHEMATFRQGQYCLVSFCV